MTKSFLTLLLTVLISLSNAWWDEGHSLVAGVAKLQLHENEIVALETPLKAWEEQYPGLSNLVTAAVWPDHIKCGFSSPFCEGLKSFDALEIFNQWHYISQIYNPQNIDLNGLLSHLPLPGTGAVWALSELVNGIPNLPKDTKWTSEPKSESNTVVRSNRHQLSQSSHHSLSIFTWNFRLRFLLHIFGDLHQPLHSVETFSEQFPLGDKGGNEILLDVSHSRVIASGIKIPNLHSLWDSCGGLYNTAWPELSEEVILKKAKALSVQYPPSFFDSRINLISFSKVAEDSYQIANETVYTDFDWTSDRPLSELPYQPSDAYIESVQLVCKQQIVLGGYRLAEVLKDIARAIRATITIEKVSKSDFLDIAASKPEMGTRLPSPQDPHAQQLFSESPSSAVLQQISNPILELLTPLSQHIISTSYWSAVLIFLLSTIAIVSFWKWIELSRHIASTNKARKRPGFADSSAAVVRLQHPLLDPRTHF